MYNGVLTALVTPFHEGPAELPAVDFEAFERLLEWQLSVPVQGIVIFGTTGESATLDDAEKLELARRTVRIVGGRVPVIAGAGSNNTRRSIDLTRMLKKEGVDGVLAVAPYYNKPTQEGLYRHFLALADEGGLPVTVYNVPSRTSVEISVDTLARLSEHPAIVAIKQAVDSASNLTELAGKVAGKAALLAGDDPIVYSVLAVGGTGVISASANVIPAELVELVRRFEAGDRAGALAIQQEVLPMIRLLFAETNPSPAKAALTLMGKIPRETLRLPLVPASDALRAKLKELVAA